MDCFQCFALLGAEEYWALDGSQGLTFLNDAHHIYYYVACAMRAIGMDIGPAPIRLSVFC